MRENEGAHTYSLSPVSQLNAFFPPFITFFLTYNLVSIWSLQFSFMSHTNRVTVVV